MSLESIRYARGTKPYVRPVEHARTMTERSRQQLLRASACRQAPAYPVRLVRLPWEHGHRPGGGAR